MYKLYKKVFNNKFLKSKIYNYVKFKDDSENNKDLKQCYINLNQYYNVQDLDIIQLIKRKEFNLLFKMIDNYFDYAIKDPIKYWYYIIQPSKQEMNELLKLIDLGFNRFKLLYNEFTPVFNQKNRSRILKKVIISGNFEIFNYLTKECGFKLDDGFRIIQWELGTEFEKLNCGGNIKLFKYIMENHFQSFSNLDQISDYIIRRISTKIVKYHYKNKELKYYGDTGIVEEYDCWNSDYSWNSDRYFKIYKYLLKQVYTIGQIDSLFSTCFTHDDLSLAKALVHFINNNINNTISKTTTTNTTTTTTTTSIIEIKLNIILIALKRIKLMTNEKSVKILKFVLENLKIENNSIYNNFNDIFIKVETPFYKELNQIVQYSINLEKINDNDKLLIQLIEMGSFPNSIEEFNYIISKPKLLAKFDLSDYKLSHFLIHISTVLVNLEYFKLVYNYFLPRSKESLNLEINKCLDTSSEIYEFIFSIFKSEEFPLSVPRPYHFKNFFFGDIKTMDHFFKYINYPQDLIFQLLNIIVYSINQGNIQKISFQYLFSKVINQNNNENNSKSLFSKVLNSIYEKKNFELFKFLLDNLYTDKQERLDLYKLLKYNEPTQVYPLYQLLIKFANQDYNSHDISFRNILINSLFIYKRGNKPLLASCGHICESLKDIKNNLEIIKSNSTKTLDLLFENEINLFIKFR